MAGTAGAIRAGRAYIEVFADTSSLSRGLRQAENQLTDFGKNIGFIGLGIATLGASIAGPLITAVNTFAKMGDSLFEMSKRTGVSVESLSELGYAAEQTGSDIIAMDRNLYLMGGFLNRAVQGSKQAAQVLDTLGLSIQDLLSLDPERRFLLFAHAIDRVTDPNQRADLARNIFGRGARNILTLLSDGAEAIDVMRQKFRNLGLTISSEDAAAADAFFDSMNDLKNVFKGFAFTVGSAVAPVLTQFTQDLLSVGAALKRWVGQNKELVGSIFKISVITVAFGSAMVAVGLTLFAFGKAIGVAILGLQGLSIVIGAVIGALTFVLSPFGIIITTLGLLAVALFDTSKVFDFFAESAAAAFGWLAGKFDGFAVHFKEVMGAIIEELRAGNVMSAAEVFWLGLVVAWDTGAIELQKIWQMLWREMFSFAVGAWAGFLTALTEIWASLKTGFAEVIAWIESKWEGLKKTVSDFSRGVALEADIEQLKWLLRNGEITLDEFQKREDKLMEAAVNDQFAADNVHKKLMEGIERDKEIQIKSVKDLSDAMLQVIESNMEKQIAGMEADLQTASADRRAQLKQSQADLQTKLDSVRAWKMFRDMDNAVPAKLGDQFGDIADRISKLNVAFNLPSGKLSSQGTFNLSNTLGLQSNSSDEIVGVLEDIRDNTDPMNNPINTYDP